MPALDHIHTYVRWKINRFKDKIIGGEQVFKCADAHCTHHQVRSMVVGKASRCTNCGSEFILSNDDTRRVHPLCFNCSNTRVAVERRAVKKQVEQLFKESEKEAKEEEQIKL